MTGITPENVGKHGVLALGESRLVGTVVHAIDGDWYEFNVDGDENGEMTLNAVWSFTPDAPKARLGMIVQNGQYPLVRLAQGWYDLRRDGFADALADKHLSHQIADPVFPGVADL